MCTNLLNQCISRTVPGAVDILGAALATNTVIANAPGPDGDSILSRFCPDGVPALKLSLGALPPTVSFAAIFLWFRC